MGSPAARFATPGFSAGRIHVAAELGARAAVVFPGAECPIKSPRGRGRMRPTGSGPRPKTSLQGDPLGSRDRKCLLKGGEMRPDGGQFPGGRMVGVSGGGRRAVAFQATRQHRRRLSLVESAPPEKQTLGVGSEVAAPGQLGHRNAP